MYISNQTMMIVARSTATAIAGNPTHPSFQPTATMDAAARRAAKRERGESAASRFNSKRARIVEATVDATTHLLQKSTTMSANATTAAAFAVKARPCSRSALPIALPTLQRGGSIHRRGKKRGHKEAVGTTILPEQQNAFHSYDPTDNPVPSHNKPFGAFSKKPRRESHVPATEFKSYSSNAPYDRGNDEGRRSDIVRINAKWERHRVDETTVKRVHFSLSHHRILFIPRVGEDSLEELRRNKPADRRLVHLARRENYGLGPGFAREASYADRMQELESRQAEFESMNAQRRAEARHITRDSRQESIEEEDVPYTEDDAAFDAVAFDHIVDKSVPLDTVVEDDDEEEVLLGLDFIEGEDVHKEDVNFDTVADNLAVELDDDDDEGDFHFLRGDGVAQPVREAGPPMGNIVQSDDDVEDVEFEAAVEPLDEDVINIQPRFTKELESTLDGKYWAETRDRTSRRRKQTVFFSPC